MGQESAGDLQVLPVAQAAAQVVYQGHAFDSWRQIRTAPEGRLISDVVDDLELPLDYAPHLQVHIGDELVPVPQWFTRRLVAGEIMCVSVRPGEDLLRSVGMIIIATLAIAYAPYLIGTGAVGASIGSMTMGAMIATAATAAVLTMAGMALLNALIPPPKPNFDLGQQKPLLTGSSNQFNPYGPIPRIFGKRRVYPLQAGRPYSESRGQDQWLRMAMVVGWGPLKVTDIRIGDTPISSYEGIEHEVREGWDNDEDLTLYTNTVHEEAMSVTLSPNGSQTNLTSVTEQYQVPQGGGSYTVAHSANLAVNDGAFHTLATGGGYNGDQPIEAILAEGSEYTRVGGVYTFPSDLAGQTINIQYRYGTSDPSGSTHSATIRTTQIESTEATIDVAAIGGLGHYNSDGNKDSITLEVSVSYSPAGQNSWTPCSWQNSTEQGLGTAGKMVFSGNDGATVIISGHVVFPAAGQYDIKVERTSPQQEVGKSLDELRLVAIRSIKPTYPVNQKGLCLLAFRMKASKQLTGTPQTINCIVESYLPIGTNGWAYALSSNPAWAFCDILRRNGGKTYLADERLHMDSINEWASACDAQATNATEATWAFDGVLEGGSVFDALKRIAAAGRASYTVIDGKHGVVRDVKQTTPVQLISPRNSWGYSGSRVFIDYPHALRVRFSNAEKNWQEDEIIVYDDGYDEESATKFDTIDLMDCTSHKRAWREGRYHIATLRLRPEEHIVNMDVENIRCTMGDLVEFQHDAISVGIGAARITSLSGGIVLDTWFSCPGGSYALRVRHANGTISTGGVSPSAPYTNTFSGDAGGAQVGDLVLLGVAEHVTSKMIVRKIEPANGLTARVVMVDAQDGVYTADTGTIPAFDSNITVVTPPEGDMPGDVTILALTPSYVTMADGTVVDQIVVSVRISDTGKEKISNVQVHWQKNSENTWNSRDFSRDTGIVLSPVEAWSIYNVRVRGVTSVGATGPWSSVTTVAVGGKPLSVTGVTGLSRSTTEAGVTFKWTKSPDSDYAATEIRSGASWSAGTVLFHGAANTWTWARPANGSYTLWFAHQNSTLKYSTAISNSFTYTATPVDNSLISIGSDGKLSGGGGGQVNLSQLPGTISSDQLATALASKVALIDASSSVDGSVNKRISDLQSSISTDIGSINSTISGINSTVSGLSGTVNSLNTQVSELLNTPAYSSGVTYDTNDMVTYNGKLYRAKQTTTGNAPTNTTYWELIGEYTSLGEVVAAHSSSINTLTSNLSGEVSARTTLAAAVNDGTTGLAATRSALINNYYVKAEVNSAISQAVTGLVSSTSLTSTLGSYVTTATLTSTYYTAAQTNTAISAATSSLVSSTSLSSTLSNYVSNSSLTTNYYTKTDTQGAIAAATQNLVSNTTLTSTLGNYVTSATLSNSYYTSTQTNSAISAAVQNLVSNTSLATTLGSYVTGATLSNSYYTQTQTNSAISAATQNLVSNASLSSTLGNYVTSGTLTSNYYTKSNVDSTIGTISGRIDTIRSQSWSNGITTDPDMLTGSEMWSLGSAGIVSGSQTNRSAARSYQQTDVVNRGRYGVDKNKQYRAAGRFRSGGGASNLRTAYLLVAVYDASGNIINGDGTYWFYPPPSGSNPGTSWVEWSSNFGYGTSHPFPSQAAFMTVGAILFYDSTNNGGAPSGGWMETEYLRIEDAESSRVEANLVNNYYTITQANNAIAAATQSLVTTTALNTALGSYVTNASLTTSYYTQSQTNNAISSAIQNLVSTTTLNSTLGSYVTNSYLTTNYYTQTQTNTAISNATQSLVSTTALNSALSGYVNTATLTNNYYTKTDTDGAISQATTTLNSRMSNGAGAAFNALLGWSFKAGNLNSWAGLAGYSGSVWGDNFIMGARANGNGDLILVRDLSLTERFSGSRADKVRVVLRKAGTPVWNGTLYYQTTVHNSGDSDSYRKVATEPVWGADGFGVAEWDMSSLTAGGNDWVNSTITRIRFDLQRNGPISQGYDIDSIAFGSRGGTDLSATVQQQASTINGVRALYTVKIDNNGYVSGFGLMSTLADGGGAVSQFYVRANDFAVIDPNKAAGAADSVPFAILSTQKTINGVTLPAGAYIHGGLMVNGTVKVTDSNGNILFGVGSSSIGGTNIIANASFDKWNTAAGRPYGWLAYTNDAATITRLQGQGMFGTDAIRFTLTNGSGSHSGSPDWAFGFVTNLTVDNSTPYKGGIMGGWDTNLTYTVTFWARSSHATAQGKGVSCAPTTQGFSQFDSLSVPGLGAGWQKYEFRVKPVNNYGWAPYGEIYFSLAGSSYNGEYPAGLWWEMSAPKVEIGRVSTGWTPSVTDTNNAALSLGINLQYNGDFSNGTDGWTWENYIAEPSSSGVNLGADWAIAPFSQPGSGTLFIAQTGHTGNGGSYIRRLGAPVPVEIGKRYCVSAYTGAHRCVVALFAYYYNSDGAILGWTSAMMNDEEASGGRLISGYKRLYSIFTVPASVTTTGQGNSTPAYMRMILQKSDTKSGYWGTASDNSYLFACRTMFEEVGALAQGPGIWCSNGLTDQTAVRSTNKITQSNIGVYMEDASINLAKINVATIGSLSALSGTIGTLRTADSGSRVEISDNVIKVYEGSTLRVKLGNLSL